MRSGIVTKWLRRAEIALAVLGVSLLGAVLATVVRSKVYQARQGRAFSGLEMRSDSPLVGNALRPTSRPSSPARPVSDPLIVARIEIPRIGLSAMVRDGTDDETLAIAVGRIPGTARPGEGGNMALAGHRDSFFKPLELIRCDDMIRIRTASGHEDYVVDYTEVVAPEDTRVLDPTADAVLTLVTCYSFVWIGHAPKRFIVRASRVIEARRDGNLVTSVGMVRP